MSPAPSLQQPVGASNQRKQWSDGAPVGRCCKFWRGCDIILATINRCIISPLGPQLTFPPRQHFCLCNAHSLAGKHWSLRSHRKDKATENSAPWLSRRSFDITDAHCSHHIDLPFLNQHCWLLRSWLRLWNLGVTNILCQLALLQREMANEESEPRLLRLGKKRSCVSRITNMATFLSPKMQAHLIPKDEWGCFSQLLGHFEKHGTVGHSLLGFGYMKRQSRVSLLGLRGGKKKGWTRRVTSVR